MDTSVGDDFLGLHNQLTTWVLFLMVVVVLAFLILTNALLLITWPSTCSVQLPCDGRYKQTSSLSLALLVFLPLDLGSEDVSHCSLEYLAGYGSRFINGWGRSSILQHSMYTFHNWMVRCMAADFWNSSLSMCECAVNKDNFLKFNFDVKFNR